MDDASEQMKQWLAAADKRRAETSLHWLRGHLNTELFDGSGPLREVIERDVGPHLSAISQTRPLIIT